MACRAFVRRHLGVSQRWELLAALSSVVLVVPMVTLLVYPQGPLHGARFLGIDLEAPSAALDAAVIGVVALRVGAARRAEGKRIEAWQWAAGALALGLFFWLMQRVAPAGLAVYVFASVLCMTLIDALVAWTFRPMRTLLAVGEKAVAAPREPRFVIPLAEVVPGEVGNKASRLGALARATSPLFDVPSGFVLRVDGGPFASAEGPAWRALLDAALRALPAAGKGLSSRFAVRSCAADEDGGASSKAGKYLSVLEVEPSQIADAVVRVRAAFGDASRAPGTGVIVQRMVEADYSGVIFTSSPGKRAMARIEFGTGLADALVGGERAPTAVHVSRFSGEILGPPLDATVGEMLERVFFAGMAIERHAGAPQDVEWAYVASERRLFVVQSRAVTAFVEPAAVEREQAHAILTAYQCGLRERDVPAWVVSASAEVVDQACPFTLSLLTAIFRPGSSYEKARAWCGLRPPPAEARTVAIFGRMYQIAARRPSVVEIVASAVADRRARRALLADHRRIVDERERTMRRLRQAAEPSPLSARSLTPRLLIHAILASVDVLVGEVYPLVFASSLAAQLTLSPRTRGLAFPTLNSEYLADLAALAAGGDLPRFLARWGHRSTSDYDLLVPSFREAPEPCLRYAQAFRDLGGRGAPEPGAPDEDPHVAFVRQREVAKDLSIALLRLSIRPRLLELAGRLGLERAEDVFFLALDDLRQLAQDIDPGARARRLAAESRADHEVLVARALPDPLTLRDLELLGVHEAAAVDPARVADPGRGQMLSVEAGFEGAVVRAEDAGPLATGAAGAVLLTRTLRPDLVPLFAHARGVVTETGGYLSHAAIVAREMGIPVLLLANARAIMTEGDVVHVTKHGDVGVDRRPAPAALPELRRAS